MAPAERSLPWVLGQAGGGTAREGGGGREARNGAEWKGCRAAGAVTRGFQAATGAGAHALSSAGAGRGRRELPKQLRLTPERPAAPQLHRGKGAPAGFLAAPRRKPTTSPAGVPVNHPPAPHRAWQRQPYCPRAPPALRGAGRRAAAGGRSRFRAGPGWRWTAGQGGSAEIQAGFLLKGRDVGCVHCAAAQGGC